MADLTARLDTADKAISALDDLVPVDRADAVSRDAAIHRFILAFEAIFATVRQYLRDAELEERGSPGACIRASRSAGLIDDTAAEALIALTKDRHLAVHVYDEAMAWALAERLPDHARTLHKWLAGVRAASG